MDVATPSFVIWIDPPQTAGGAFAGRVEHVQTSARSSFHNADELLAFLEACRRGEAGDG